VRALDESAYMQSRGLIKGDLGVRLVTRGGACWVSCTVLVDCARLLSGHPVLASDRIVSLLHKHCQQVLPLIGHWTRVHACNHMPCSEEAMA
jgi:hypothetical protein